MVTKPNLKDRHSKKANFSYLVKAEFYFSILESYFSSRFDIDSFITPSIVSFSPKFNRVIELRSYLKAYAIWDAVVWG